MKKGFTLAEVLITLAVIGVVAALTIPVLVQKYQKKQLYTQFMKAYNTFSSAVELAVSEHGSTEDWKWGEREEDEETGEESVVGGDDPFTNYILPNIKVIKTCDDINDCFAESYSALGGDETYPITEIAFYRGDNAVVLADGSVATIGGDNTEGYIYVDTNGKKGPNTLGRDLFILMTGTGRVEDSIEVYEYNSDTTSDSSGRVRANCNPSVSSNGNGIGCASRLLQEGKMDY